MLQNWVDLKDIWGVVTGHGSWGSIEIMNMMDDGIKEDCMFVDEDDWKQAWTRLHQIS